MNKFKCFILILVIFLIIACIYGWYEVENYVDNFENNISKEDVIEEEILEKEELSNDDILKYSELCTEVAVNYAKYISGEIEFKNIKKYFSTGTDTYNYLSEFNNNRFTDFDSSKILNEEIISIEYINNEIECEIKFEYIIYIDNEEYIYESHYVVLFNEYTSLVESIIMK